MEGGGGVIYDSSSLAQIGLKDLVSKFSTIPIKVPKLCSCNSWFFSIYPGDIEGLYAYNIEVLLKIYK